MTVATIINGLASLLKGLGVTLKEFFTKKVTEQYPDNRSTLTLPDRFRGSLYMPRNEDGSNRCIACSLCATNCPNDTLTLEIETVTDEATGKSKRRLKRYLYNLGSCMYCRLCVNVCPSDAIAFDNKFEHAVFNKETLIKTLN